MNRWRAQVDSRGVGEVSDDELLSRCGRGDADALAELYDRHAGWLLLRLRRRCGTPDVVEEVLQDTFMSVWRGADSYVSQGTPAAWLWTVASRRLVDALRVRSRLVMVDAGQQTEVLGPEELVVTDLAYGDLGGALDRLSPELRQVLQATVIDGLTVREAAVVLGIPEGTVKTRSARARRQLRAGLA